MIAVFQSELYRVRKSKIFIVCLSLALLFVLALVLSYNFEQVRAHEKGEISGTPSIAGFTEYLFSDYSILSPLLLFLIIHITSDFKQGLYPVLLSKGVKRTDILWGKLLSCLCAMVLYLGVCLVFAYTLIITTWANISKIGVPIFEIGTYLFIQFLSLGAYTTFVLMICYLLRNRTVSFFVNVFLLGVLWLHLTKIGTALDMSYPLYQYWIVGLSHGLQIEQIPQYIDRIVITIASYFIISIVVTRITFSHFDIKHLEKGKL
ncbi:ABC transporter permease [Planococcus alpniumensis]|uniref:ABC transporter permease n=1 Tax=Planococcus alpniumensis TaxID=2708345 RepID=UPI001B8C9663|nr:ABC transporter permease subunit [Planococcus sp. MSAK28401]